MSKKKPTKEFLTRRNEMKEEELLSLERIAAVGKISGSIAHEIRNPLSVIEGVVYLLKPKLRETDKESYDYLDRIEIQISRITGIVKSLQSLTDIEETGKVRLDLAEAIEVALGRAEVPARIEVVKEVPKEKFIIMADKGQMAMVFTNLISNAVQSIMEEGTLWIKARWTNEEEIELSFKDTGCGIAQENLRKVFWPLFSSKARGMGFGLTLSQMIVERHGGKIAAESEPGEGTTFVI
ncbi:histidine kinase, partial [bacterium]|nr:histidine kinase [bacterium]